MLIIGLIVLSALFLANIGVGTYNLVQVKRTNDRYDKFSEDLVAFITPPNSETPSDFNKILIEIASIFADRYRVAMTSAANGAQGAAVRDVNRGLEEIAVAADPSLAVAQVLPKSLKKNPLALAGLNMLMQNVMSKQGSQVPGENGSRSMGSQVKFNL